MVELTADQVARKRWAAFWGTRNRAPNEQDKIYWNTQFWNDLDRHGLEEMNPPHPNYAYDRALGWQAMGSDVPPFGPYAQPPTPLQPVPPYPGDEQPPPDPIPPPMTENGTLDDRLARIEALLAKAVAQGTEQLAAIRTQLDAVQRMSYTGSGRIPYLGTTTFTLDPVRPKTLAKLP